MDRQKLLIVDPDAEYCSMLERSFTGSGMFDVQRSAQTGEEALKRIAEGDIHVILLNIVIPKDGPEVLNRISSMGLTDPPKVFIQSTICTDYVLSLVQSLGALYFFQRPIEPAVMVKRISDFLYGDQCADKGAITQYTPRNDGKREQMLEDVITSLILKLNIPASIKGFRYIRKSIQLYTENKNCKGMTTHIYPAVAKAFGSTPSRVERAIRHAISVAWNRSTADVLNEMFGYTVNKDKGMSTNSEFIAILADRALIEVKKIV
jgi:two-component system response regulator (stage 0 sporulation protein A)